LILLIDIVIDALFAPLCAHLAYFFGFVYCIVNTIFEL